MRNTGGTDHLSFDAVGIPGFQFIQDMLDYESRTHHSNEDVVERLAACRPEADRDSRGDLRLQRRAARPDAAAQTVARFAWGGEAACAARGCFSWRGDACFRREEVARACLYAESAAAGPPCQAGSSDISESGTSAKLLGVRPRAERTRQCARRCFHNHVRGVAQPGRAPGSGPGGRRFKSSLPDH